MTQPISQPGYSMSKRGWISVDYDQRVWIPCPPVFPDGGDRESWAALFAEEWWAAPGRMHRTRDVKRLARTLAGMHEIAYAELAMHNGLIHLPDLALVPLLVSFGIWEAAGDREEQLRALVHADDPEAIQPVVEEFGTARLGPGLKVLACTRSNNGTVTGHVNYAWRSEEHATAVRMFAGCLDLGRLRLAVPDMEQLARGAAIIPRDRGR